MTPEDERALERTFQGMIEYRDRQEIEGRYVPTGGFTNATLNNSAFSYARTAWPGKTAFVLRKVGLPYRLARKPE